jgi:hypothetical protein
MEPFDEQQPTDEAPSPQPSVLRRRLAAGALVVAAALGGVGFGVASADDDPDPAVPVQADDGDVTKTGCDRSGAPDRGVL